MVSKPDKGKSIVIVDKPHYITGLQNILDNSGKFEPITDEICRESWLLEDKINSFLLKLRDLGHLSQLIYKELHVSGSGPGILYGLPKIHKPLFLENYLYRPIFAAYNVASYKFSKFLVNILAPLAENQYTLKNSAQFKSEEESVPHSNTLIMASFDIKDLYTNVPLQETIDICVSSLGNILGLPAELFRKLLELAVLNTMFMFNGKFYRQKDGLGMGLPLSPTMANVFLCHHEQDWLENCPAHFRPVYFRRYMDDTFTLFRHEDHVQQFLDYLNSKHSNMVFTSEIEQEGKLAFLDCTVHRNNDQFTTSVYRKSTFSGLGSSFYSFVPMIFKVNSIKTLLFRAHSISSSFTSLNKEFSFLHSYFTQNGFPNGLFYRQINKFINRIMHPPLPTLTAEKKSMYISIPYAGTQSEKLKNDILILVGRFFPYINLEISLTNKFTIGSLFKYKDRLPFDLQSSVVYLYSCARCASGTYVGSTIRAIHMRIAEHRGRSFRTGKLMANPPKSSIRDHAFHCSKTISPSEFKIIGQEKNENYLRILESILIRSHKSNLNKMESAYPLKILGS